MEKQRRAQARKILLAYLERAVNVWADMSALEALVEETLAELSACLTGTSADGAPTMPTPAKIADSILPDGLVSFIDGQVRKTLKRHLTTHGLDPHGYRERYGLPADYPMVCPDYTARRAEIAKAIGLGGSRSKPRR